MVFVIGEKTKTHSAGDKQKNGERWQHGCPRSPQ
jgi:hypothetical protein